MFRRVIRAANNDSVITRDTFSAATCSLRKKVNSVAPDRGDDAQQLETDFVGARMLAQVSAYARSGQEHFQTAGDTFCPGAQPLGEAARLSAYTGRRRLRAN